MTFDDFNQSTLYNYSSTGADSSQLERPVPTLTLLAHPDMRRAGEVSQLIGLANGRELYLSRTEPDFAPVHQLLGKPLGDPFVSRKPIRFQPVGRGGIQIDALTGSKLKIKGKRVTLIDLGPDQLDAGVVLEIAERVCLFLQMRRDFRPKPPEINDMIGHAVALENLQSDIMQCAHSDLPVLIRGETGTGKEITARAIHDTGKNANGPFIAVNMAAITGSIAASELFGAVRGAFTGSIRERPGYFRAADGGTLFLDEIGEMDPTIQAMLLRTLETSEVMPVGADKAVPVNVRVVAATDADLEAMIEEGRFREPLFYRLCGHDIRTPTLRSRKEDMGRLFKLFAREELIKLRQLEKLERHDPRERPWLPTPLAAFLADYPWPGNVRQFRNIIIHLIQSHKDSSTLNFTRKLESLPPLPTKPEPARTEPAVPESLDRKPREITREDLVTACRKFRWNFQAVADELGVSRGSIYVLIKRYELPAATDLTADQIKAALAVHGQDLNAVADVLEVSPRALKRRISELGGQM